VTVGVHPQDARHHNGRELGHQRWLKKSLSAIKSTTTNGGNHSLKKFVC
jgi:hypothetical protein